MKIKIGFDYIPNEYGVNQWGDNGAKTVALERGNSFTLPQKKGIYVYDVYAYWKEGSGSFAFWLDV